MPFEPKFSFTAQIATDPLLDDDRGEPPQAGFLGDEALPWGRILTLPRSVGLRHESGKLPT